MSFKSNIIEKYSPIRLFVNNLKTMKQTLILTILCLICALGYSQKLAIDSLTGKYQTIIKMEFDTSTDKTVLYRNVKEWIAINYKSAKDVFQYEDETNYDKIIAKGTFSTNMFMKEGWINHTMIINFKKGKVRITYKDFSYYSAGSGNINFEGSMMSKKKIITETETRIVDSIDSLKKQVLQNKNEEKEW